MRKTRNYYTSSNYANSIPAREEFHKYASNEISEGDFCTNYSSGYQINKVANAISWTYSNEKKRNNTYNNYKMMKG